MILSSTELLRNPTGWVTGPPLPIPLTGHCLTPVDEGSEETFFLNGGKTASHINSAKQWLFHWSNQTWQDLPDMGTGIKEHGCAPFRAGDGARMIMTAGGVDNSGPRQVPKEGGNDLNLTKRI